jgi:hypothetical protein
LAIRRAEVGSLTGPGTILEPEMVLGWFRSSIKNKPDCMPNQAQIQPLIDFLVMAKRGDSARLLSYKNPSADRRFTRALEELEKTAVEALQDTAQNSRRANEELSDKGMWKEFMATKFENDKLALLELIRVVRGNRERFPVRQHKTRFAEWHEGLWAITMLVCASFRDAGRSHSVGKPTAPAVKVIVQALAYLEGQEREPDAVVDALRPKISKHKRLSKQGVMRAE